MTGTLPSLDEFRALLARELASIESPAHRRFAESVLVEPTRKILRWEWGQGEECPAWVFADLRERNVGAAYCLGGFGAAGSPWGLVFLHDDSFGMDAGWYPTLDELVREWCFDPDG